MQEEIKNAESEGKAAEAKPEPEKPAPAFIGLDKKGDKPTKEEEVGLRELLEKNLKWSQIIYEQNRRIGRRLLLGSIASWVKWAIIIGALIWGTWYVWPLTKDLVSQYQALIGGSPSGQKLDPATLDKILRMIPLSESEKDQIKAMNK